MAAKYMMKSHADFSKDISGQTLFYQVFDAAGLQCGEFSGSPESAVEYAKVQSLEFIAPADLLRIRRENETPPPTHAFCAGTVTKEVRHD